MPEKTKQKESNQKREEKGTDRTPFENHKIDEQGNWSEDQQKKSYYYDDAYGYEIYNPDEDDEA